MFGPQHTHIRWLITACYSSPRDSNISDLGRHLHSHVYTHPQYGHTCVHTIKNKNNLKKEQIKILAMIIRKQPSRHPKIHIVFQIDTHLISPVSHCSLACLFSQQSNHSVVLDFHGNNKLTELIHLQRKKEKPRGLS